LADFPKFYVNPDDEMRKNVADFILTLVGFKGSQMINKMEKENEQEFKKLREVFL